MQSDIRFTIQFKQRHAAANQRIELSPSDLLATHDNHMVGSTREDALNSNWNAVRRASPDSTLGICNSIYEFSKTNK
jgi:hypothetical protein